MKKTLLIVIDALASRVVRPAVERGELPHLALLAQAGEVAWNCTSIFPSITPAATSSIITGRYPASHHITGAFYYDRELDHVHYYGSDFWVIVAHQGMAEFFREFLVQLNCQRLGGETLFEICEGQGQTAASLNYLVFRGNHQHESHTPLTLMMIPGIPAAESLPGPTYMALGDFVKQSQELKTQLRSPVASGIANRFGFNDNATGEQLLQLAEQGFPDFTLAYFPENDFDSHDVGPQQALRTVANVDDWIGKLIRRCGGVAELLREVTVVVTGDHSQSDMLADPAKAGIELDRLLSDYQLAAPGESWAEGDEVMACPNLRAAQIYCRPALKDRHGQLVEALLADERVDQVLWQNSEQDQPCTFHVATADRGRLRFRAGEGNSEGRGAVRDHYGQFWQYEGNLATVDGVIDAQGLLHCQGYPNALERIALSFDDRYVGDMWVTARPGHEFVLPQTKLNGGGSHATLHVDDSTAPLILAGAPQGVQLPAQPRIVDIAPLVLACLEIDSPFAIGNGHMALNS